MTEMTLIILGALIGAIATYGVMRNKQAICESHGISTYTEKQQAEKQERKARILEMLQEKGSITNDDIEQPLGISHPTAANYLHELVQEGKIEQNGERGRFVSYQLKK
ncbi:DUF977 family protein [Candidatus Uhrbacteria bacterium]|nr:DUF977 family protein [Candidatus Uhrbacteria bacterium]